MPPLFGRAPRPLCALAALCLALLAPVAADADPARIDFGQPLGEDSLLGAGEPAIGWRDTTPERFDRRFPAPIERSAYRKSSPSVIIYNSRPRPSFTRGTGIFANANPSGGSVVVLASRDRGEEGSFGTTGPKFIDVAAERLDRQPIGPGGISVHRVGTAKIIRIAAAGESRERRPEKDMAPLPRPAPTPPPRSVAPAEPVERAAPREDVSREIEAPVVPQAEPLEDAPPAQVETGATPLEPWTDEWLRDCVARHESFDASLGTYLGEDGRRRFCTGEPA